MYSSGGDLHLELPTGQQGGTTKLWEIPPFETKGVMRASFSSRDADNHTAFIRIKTNAPDQDQFIILPVEVEVTSAPGIYSSTEMLDFGTLRSQDRPKQLNLHLLNSGSKDVPITSVRTTPSNEAVTVEFKAITLKAEEGRYTKVASISFDASKARRPFQFSGKITVKAKEKTYSKLEIPYQAEVLEGYLGFDHTATLFHIRDSPVDPVDRAILLTNTFNFAIRVHNISLPQEAKTMFRVVNYSDPVLIPAHETRYIFSLLFRPVRPSIHIDSNILLITNASKFHLPVRAYTGVLEPLVLAPSLTENLVDFGVRSATDTSSIVLIVVNSNPIELEIKSWLVTGDSLSVELLRTEKGNRTAALGRSRELHNTSASHHKTVILASGYYAAFRVTLVAKSLEGMYDGAVHITTDYEILTVPVKAVIAVGTLSSSPEHIILPQSFPGKIVHHTFSIQSSFTQRVRLQQIRSLTQDVRFYYKRLRSNKDELEPSRKSKVANIYFDASLNCGDHCYVGLPFVLKSEARPHGLTLQEDIWDADVDLHQKLLRRWRELQERSGHEVEAVFEVNTDLQKNVQATITAKQAWPSLVNSSQPIIFPLTNTNSSSEEEVFLENPADVPVYVQVLPLALYPNPSVFAGKLAHRFPLGKLSNINIDTNTLEFQVHKNQVDSGGFVEGSTRPFVYNLLLQPREVKSFSLRFTPVSNHTVSSLVIVNNLTVMDMIMVHGQGSRESLKVAGKPPGPGSFLRFKMTEALLKDCTEKMRSNEPVFTLRRTFRVENTGLLPIYIRSAEINGLPCQGYGFKVLNCQEFALQPNASKDLVILFTPDFTSSRVIRELKLVTDAGSEFVFVLNASLPYHMLASCAETLPGPTWELELYIIVSLIMSSMFLLVVATAYLEAQGIWEPFKRRLSLESNSSMETGRPFDLREIVRVARRPPLRGKTKVQRRREEKERRTKGKAPTGEELKDALVDNDDSSSTTTETSNPDVETSIREEPVKKKGRTAETMEKEKKDTLLTKPKNVRKQTNTKKETDGSNSLELPYVTPLENKQRKTFTTKALIRPAFNPVPKGRTLPKPRGKLLYRSQLSRASVSVPELGHSSSSDGEKDFASPEWDIPLLSKTTNHSLQLISLQTRNADSFLKKTSSARTCSPTPSSPSLVARGTYSQVLNASSENHLKKAPGNKLVNAPSLPGKNGNPTFAAVAAGYDRSPGGSGPGRCDAQGKPLCHMTSVESDSSDSSGLWSPIDANASSPGFNSVNSFSAFGPNNSFNLTGGNFPKTSEPQPSWPEFSPVSPSIWDIPSTSDPLPLHSWPTSSGSATTPSSILGSTRNPWSSTTPFSNSIWSTSGDPTLHSFSPATTSTLSDLAGNTPAVAPAPSLAPTELSHTYNYWSMWRPTLSRRRSEPWNTSKLETK
uniref:Transmembrane protein 131 n=1 Tax=Esox lucius TaxID=8010 RepID=A0A3P8ZSL1_ESOLU